jgi:hypothetical protein
VQSEQSYNIAGRTLFVALPAYDFKVSLKLAISLARVAQDAPKYGVDVQIGSICGCSVVSRARNALAKDFLESDATDLLFIDSDINFEPADVFRLMAWTSNPKAGIVAGVPRTRSTSGVYIATLDYEHRDNGAVAIAQNSMGLVRAQRVATAFMMVRRDVFEKLKDAHPEWVYYDQRLENNMTAFFDFKVTPEGYIGEDYLFCDRAREHGFEVWIDPTIKLGHMGVQEFLGDFSEDVLKPMFKEE